MQSLYLAVIAVALVWTIDFKIDRYYKRKKVERDGVQAMLEAREKYDRGY